MFLRIPVLGGIAIIATSYRLDGTLRVDFELNLTVDQERVSLGPQACQYYYMCYVCNAGVQVAGVRAGSEVLLY